MSSKKVYTLFETLRNYVNEQHIESKEPVLQEEEPKLEMGGHWTDKLSDDDPGLFKLKLNRSQFKSPKENPLQEQVALPRTWYDELLKQIPTDPLSKEDEALEWFLKNRPDSQPVETVDVTNVPDTEAFGPSSLPSVKKPAIAAPVDTESEFYFPKWYFGEPTEGDLATGEDMPLSTVDVRSPVQIKGDEDFGLEQVELPYSRGKDTHYTRGKGVHKHFGERDTINLIRNVAQDLKDIGMGKLRVWSISKKGGGEFPPHGTHRSGRDIDIGIDPEDLQKNYNIAQLFASYGEDARNLNPQTLKPTKKNQIKIIYKPSLVHKLREWADEKVQDETTGEWHFKNNTSEYWNKVLFGKCTGRDPDSGGCTGRSFRGVFWPDSKEGHGKHYHVRTEKDPHAKRNVIRYTNLGLPPDEAKKHVSPVYPYEETLLPMPDTKDGNAYYPYDEPADDEPVADKPLQRPQDDRDVEEAEYKDSEAPESTADDWVWDSKAQTWINTKAHPVRKRATKKIQKRYKKKRAKQRQQRQYKKAPPASKTTSDQFKGVFKENINLLEQAPMPMDPIQQQIQMSIQAAQEQLGPLFGQIQGMLVQMRTLNTPAANQEVKRQTNRIELITNDLNDGDIDIMTAIGQLGNIANDMGKKMQKLTQG